MMSSEIAQAMNAYPPPSLDVVEERKSKIGT